MIEILPLFILGATLGAGLVTGLLFAFSNFVLDALAELEPQSGMFAMQRINRRIQNPLFFLLFFGTPLACAAVALIASLAPDLVGRWWLVGGAVLYLLGPFGVTLLHNVPLNRRLDATDCSEEERIWAGYRRRWQFWNHIRTALGILAFGALVIGALSI